MKIGEIHMPQAVYKLSQQTIYQMKHYYQSSLTTTPQGAIFRAKTPEAVITAYKSGKVLFQGAAPEKESKKWANTNEVVAPKAASRSQRTPHAFVPPTTLYTSNHMGTDEAGTGDYFGPITVAGVYLTQDQIHYLKTIGVTDSKTITDTKIRELAKKITAMNIPYSLMVLRNEKYNQLQKKGWSQGKMKAVLHQHAINKLQEKIQGQQIEGIIIDQFCEPPIYQRHIRSEQLSLLPHTYFLTKAESYSTAVAAGSIIARASFLKEMDALSKSTGMTLPKGASKIVDETIAQIIHKYGWDFLNKCGKTHFANTKKANTYL